MIYPNLHMHTYIHKYLQLHTLGTYVLIHMLNHVPIWCEIFIYADLTFLKKNNKKTKKKKKKKKKDKTK